jgi:hypothetical protein
MVDFLPDRLKSQGASVGIAKNTIKVLDETNHRTFSGLYKINGRQEKQGHADSTLFL